MKLAMYRGPANLFYGRLVHWLVTAWTDSEYSHCELIIDGLCYSSSDRDGGVRAKQIKFDSEKWDIFDIGGDEEYAKNWFMERINRHKYDYAGVFHFVLPFIHENPDKWFCSEACAQALKLEHPETYSPETLFRTLVKEK